MPLSTQNSTLKGALVPQMLFQGNEEPTGAKRMIKRLDLKQPPLGRDPTYFIKQKNNT